MNPHVFIYIINILLILFQEQISIIAYCFVYFYFTRLE